MSMEGVAAAAGTTASGLRHRFRGKPELLLAGIDAMAAGLLPGATGELRASALAIPGNLGASRPGGTPWPSLRTVRSTGECGAGPELADHGFR